MTFLEDDMQLKYRPWPVSLESVLLVVMDQVLIDLDLGPVVQSSIKLILG